MSVVMSHYSNTDKDLRMLRMARTHLSVLSVMGPYKHPQNPGSASKFLKLPKFRRG